MRHGSGARRQQLQNSGPARTGDSAIVIIIVAIVIVITATQDDELKSSSVTPPPAAEAREERAPEATGGAAVAAAEASQKQQAMQRLQRAGLKVRPLGPECLVQSEAEPSKAPATPPRQQLAGHDPPSLLESSAAPLPTGLSRLLSTPHSKSSPLSSHDPQTPSRAWVPGSSWQPECPRTSPSHYQSSSPSPGSPTPEWPQKQEASEWPQKAPEWPQKREASAEGWPQRCEGQVPQLAPERSPEPQDSSSQWSGGSPLTSPAHGSSFNPRPVPMRLALDSIKSSATSPAIHQAAGDGMSSPRLTDAVAKLRGRGEAWGPQGATASAARAASQGPAAALSLPLPPRSARSARSASPGPAAFRTPSHSPRGGIGGLSPADMSLLPRRGGPAWGGDDPWQGWSVETDARGQLFYYHTQSGTSQWEQPRELTAGFGEWHKAQDGQGNEFWRNDLLGVSSWTDPRNTTNVFQAAESGDLFWFQLYAYANGDVNAVDAQGCTALHYTCAAGNAQLVSFLLQSQASTSILYSIRLYIRLLYPLLYALQMYADFLVLLFNVCITI